MPLTDARPGVCYAFAPAAPSLSSLAPWTGWALVDKFDLWVLAWAIAGRLRWGVDR